MAKELDNDLVDPSWFPDLRIELKELNTVSREVFSKFIDWWKFFITANIAAFVAFKELSALKEFFFYVAPIVAFVDFVGIGFCFITCCRFVQISDRYDEILSTIYPNARKGKLPRSTTVAGMTRLIWCNLFSEPERNDQAPDSPIPSRYQLICALGLMPACLLIGILWILGLFKIIAW